MRLLRRKAQPGKTNLKLITSGRPMRIKSEESLPLSPLSVNSEPLFSSALAPKNGRRLHPPGQPIVPREPAGEYSPNEKIARARDLRHARSILLLILLIKGRTDSSRSKASDFGPYKQAQRNDRGTKKYLSITLPDFMPGWAKMSPKDQKAERERQEVELMTTFCASDERRGRRRWHALLQRHLSQENRYVGTHSIARSTGRVPTSSSWCL